MEKPVFSYQVEEAAGKTQLAARIRVSVRADMSVLILDTGFSPAIDSLAYEADIALTPRTRYYWTVNVRTDAGEEAQSDVNWFETAKMQEPWQARWVTCDSGEPRHPIFTKTLPVDRQVASARLYICGLGLYEAYLNDERVGAEYLTPYSNDYREWLQYQTYDITAQLNKGGKLAVILGNGWYKGRFGFTSTLESAGYYGNDWKLIAEVRVVYTDGNEAVFGTDTSWPVTRSDITFSNLYDGEHADANLNPGASVPAALCAEPSAPLLARYSTAVTVHEQMKPIALLHTPAGETVLDIGQNLAGSFRLKVHIPKGEQIRLQFGEIMQNGCFYRDNLRTAKAEYLWTSDGNPHVLQPRFTFYGYRYVKAEGAPNLQKDDFTALALYSDIEPAGFLQTGHALVNRLIQNTQWGQKSNYLDVPTDCPQRDERMGWTGDAQVFSPTAAYLTDCYAFMRKYLYDMAREQEARGGMVPDVIPSFGHGNTACVWGDATCIIPWNLYIFYGDVQILRDHYGSMKAWINYIGQQDGVTREWGKRFHYGDWLALDRHSVKPDEALGGTDEGFIAYVYYRHSAMLTAKAAAVLGKSEDRAHYGALAEEILRYIQSEYFSVTGRCCADTQTAHIMTLYFNLTEDRTRAKAALDRLFVLSGGKLRTGFVGTPLLCNVLSDEGDANMAYSLLLNEEYPGWLYAVKLGATTLWERWNSVTEDGSLSSTGMNSLNHYAYGSITEWIFRHAAGINPVEDAPGFRKARLIPTPDERLGFLEAEYRSAAGTFRVAWRMEDSRRLSLRITVPFGCTAELVLPFAPDSVYQDRSNPLFADVRDGICHLRAGEYAVGYPLP
jgi:alpha-L-rhamnosidase